MISPVVKDIIEYITLEITTLLNFLNICIDEIVGNIIKLEISNDPTNFIPKTTTIEHNIANMMLYIFVLIPIELVNLSSNVIANILL